MKVIVNKEHKEINKECKIIEMLEILNIKNTQGLAIAINNTVIKKDDWKNYQLKENDNILLIKATQGG